MFWTKEALNFFLTSSRCICLEQWFYMFRFYDTTCLLWKLSFWKCTEARPCPKGKKMALAPTHTHAHSNFPYSHSCMRHRVRIMKLTLAACSENRLNLIVSFICISSLSVQILPLFFLLHISQNEIQNEWLCPFICLYFQTKREKVRMVIIWEIH